MNRSASACSRDSARSMVSNGVRRRRLAERRLQRGERLGGAAHPLAHRPGDVEPRLHALRRGPGVADVGKAVRAGRLPERHAHEIESLQVKPWVVRLKTGRSRRGDDKFERRADLAALRSPGAVVRDERRDDDRKVAVAVLKPPRECGDEIGRRVVGDEMAHELHRDMLRRRGMPGEIVEHRAPLPDAGFRIGLAEDFPRARFVPAGLEIEGSERAQLAVRPRHAPAGDGASKLGDVGLSIAGPDAEGVKLHDLARQVLVQSPAGEPSRRGVGTDRVLVVEEENHRGMRFRRDEQGRELAEHVGADRLALEGTGFHPQLCALGDGDGEMVGPESDQPLDEARARLELLGKTRLGFGEELRLLDRLRGRGLRRFGLRGLGFARLDHRRAARAAPWTGRPRSRPATDPPKDRRRRFADRRAASGSAPPSASRPRPSWRALRECLPLGGSRPGALGFPRAERGRGSARHWPSTVLRGESRADRPPLRSGRPAARRSRTG